MEKDQVTDRLRGQVRVRVRVRVMVRVKVMLRVRVKEVGGRHVFLPPSIS